MTFPGKLGSANDVTEHSNRDADDCDGDFDAPLPNESLAKQARRSWQAIDSKLQNNSNLGDEPLMTPKTTRGRWGSGASLVVEAASGTHNSPTPSTSSSSIAMGGLNNQSQSPQNKFATSFSSLAVQVPRMPPRRNQENNNISDAPILRGNRVFHIEKASKGVTGGVSSFLPEVPSAADASWIKKNSPTLNKKEIKEEEEEEEEETEKFRLDDNDEEFMPSITRLSETSSLQCSIPTFTDETLRKSIKENTVIEELELKGGETEHEDDYEFEDEQNELQNASGDAEGEGENRFLVDKVPLKKRWSSKNVHNFPVWPPVIKVKTWERKNVSGISVGSGMSEISEDYVSSIGEDDYTTEDGDFTRRPAEKRTSYRIRYDGPTSFDLNKIYNVPPIAANPNRFEPATKLPDGAPNLPARASDAAPRAPPRKLESASEEFSDGDDDESIGLEEVDEKRPDVWITPLESSTNEARWKVKRVWAVEEQDENEMEHNVRNQELYRRIKSLVGCPESPPASPTNVNDDGLPKMPTRSWHVQTVVERKGKLEDLEPEKELDDNDLLQNIEVMAEENVKEVEQNKISFLEAKKRREERRKEEQNMDAAFFGEPKDESGEKVDENEVEKVDEGDPSDFKLELKDDVNDSATPEHDGEKVVDKIKDVSPAAEENIVPTSEEDHILATSKDLDDALPSPPKVEEEPRTPVPEAHKRMETLEIEDPYTPVLDKHIITDGVKDRDCEKERNHVEVTPKIESSDSSTPSVREKSVSPRKSNEHDETFSSPRKSKDPDEALISPRKSKSKKDKDLHASTHGKKEKKKKKKSKKKRSDDSPPHSSKHEEEKEPKTPKTPKTPRSARSHRRTISSVKEMEHPAAHLDLSSDSSSSDSEEEIHSPAKSTQARSSQSPKPVRELVQPRRARSTRSPKPIREHSGHTPRRSLSSRSPKPNRDSERQLRGSKKSANKKVVTAASMVHDSSDSGLDVSSDDDSSASEKMPSRFGRSTQEATEGKSPWWRKDADDSFGPNTPVRGGGRAILHRKPPSVRAPPLSTKKGRKGNRRED